MVRRLSARGGDMTKANAAKKADEDLPVPALLTVTQAMYSLGDISRGTLYRLIREKKLRTVLIGSRRLVPADAIAKCIEALPTN
jgi:excisionase family DNA binding protein